MSDAALVFTPISEFAAVKEPGAEPLARATVGGTAIPSRGLVIFYGGEGAGKTTLTIDLIFALAAGRSWLGLVEPDRPLRVVIIEAEGPRAEFREKLERKLAHHGADTIQDEKGDRVVLLEEPWAEFTFADEGQRRELAQAIDAHETDLVVVGPVAAVGMVGGGTPPEIRAFEELLTKLRALVERPFAIVLVHHENKAGQVSGAWGRVPDTFVHVTAQGNGRTRLYWDKARWAGKLHKTATQLIWADGESFTVEAKPDITDDTMTDELLEAVLANPGVSWTRLRELNNADGKKLVRGNVTELAVVRDRLIAAGTLLNTAAQEGRFNLCHREDPAVPRSEPGTDPERLPFPSPDGAPHPDRSAVPSIERNGSGNGTGGEPETDLEWNPFEEPVWP